MDEPAYPDMKFIYLESLANLLITICFQKNAVFVSGRKSFKIAAKSVGKQTLR